MDAHAVNLAGSAKSSNFLFPRQLVASVSVLPETIKKLPERQRTRRTERTTESLEPSWGETAVQHIVENSCSKDGDVELLSDRERVADHLRDRQVVSLSCACRLRSLEYTQTASERTGQYVRLRTFRLSTSSSRKDSSV